MNVPATAWLVAWGFNFNAGASMNIRFGRAAAAGIAGAFVMSAVGLWVAPLMGIPPMNPADMLAAQFGGVGLLGWTGHLLIGVILALGYTLVAPWLAGPPTARGGVYAIGPFLMAQILVIPMMGMPLFSGSWVLAAGSLIGHLVYGAVVGALYGSVPARNHVTSGRPAEAAR
jgi:hypothetical protein